MSRRTQKTLSSMLRSLWWLIFVPQHTLSEQKQLLANTDWFPHIDLKRPVPLDIIRIPLQLLWLILIKPKYSRSESALHKVWKALGYLKYLYPSWLFRYIRKKTKITEQLDLQATQQANTLKKHWLFDHPITHYGSLILCVIIMILGITTPFDLLTQALFVALLWFTALWIRQVPGHFATMLLIILSVTVSSRYLWWRFNATLNWDDLIDLTLGLGLLAAEVYTWIILLLGFFQTAWPLQRQPKELPKNLEDWPSVDIFIPTYNEPLSVVRPTVYAAQAIDWPTEKLNIYILDDGCRTEFKHFAEQAGINYFERKESTHAKAGNLNLALTKTQGEFIAIFDCDHIPTRSFLQTSMGLFLKDRKLALIQTPHHFFSPDPFERNLGNFGKVPNENELFYGLVQDGNDLWNAAFFCGSCAILRRDPLEEIGGIAVETVTEDAHTSFRLHKLGYKSAYLREPQAAGLATESLSAHVGQRIRWARGMAQIFRVDNPLMAKTLSWGQRLCYSNAMIHFLYGLPRLVFLTAPLAFLLFHAYIIHASALALALYVLPHIIHSNITNSRIQGKYRHSFWAEVYETALAWYIARPTTIALIDPNKGSFNVTAKGGLVEKEHFDWSISTPYIVLVILNLLGFGVGIWRLFTGPDHELGTVIITMIWTAYNLLTLGASMAVAEESKQVRVSHRVGMQLPVTLHLQNGYVIHANTSDFSEGGLGIVIDNPKLFNTGDELTLSLKQSARVFTFPVIVTNCFSKHLGVRFDNLTAEQERNLVNCTFSRADAWVDRNKNREEDRPVQSLLGMMKVGLKGFVRLKNHVMPFFEPILKPLRRIMNFILWLLPRDPQRI